MSRVGKKPVIIPSGVDCSIDKDILRVKGPKGENTLRLVPQIEIEVNKESNKIFVRRNSDEKKLKSLHGLYRKLIYNMIIGVTEGFKRELEIVGIGYKAQVKGNELILNIGFSHPVTFIIPEGVNITVEKQRRIIVSGIDKSCVGKVSSEIRQIKPPEPYKGKGIKYIEEHIRRKVGKAAAATTKGEK